jgi:hypothetical protein
MSDGRVIRVEFTVAWYRGSGRAEDPHVTELHR